jgi:Uma2 family endonuclease
MWGVSWRYRISPPFRDRPSPESPLESNGGLELPDSSIKAADAAWILLERWRRLSKNERASFAPICPDFVSELRSASDSMSALRQRMALYLDNGVRLGWLIDPYARRVEIFRAGREVEVLLDPATVSGDDVLPGFVLELGPIFND